MFMVKNTQNEYLNAEPRMFTNVPVIVARFVNEKPLGSHDTNHEIPHRH